MSDFDGDGLTSSEETALGTSDFAADSDGDGLTDREERDLGTDATAVDSDGDGVSDGFEVQHLGTDATRTDTDGDGASDLVDVEGTNAGVQTRAQQDWADTDGDSLPDTWELAHSSAVDDLDSDDDGIFDGQDADSFQGNDSGVQHAQPVAQPDLWDTVARVGTAVATGGLSEVARGVAQAEGVEGTALGQALDTATDVLGSPVSATVGSIEAGAKLASGDLEGAAAAGLGTIDDATFGGATVTTSDDGSVSVDVGGHVGPSVGIDVGPGGLHADMVVIGAQADLDRDGDRESFGVGTTADLAIDGDRVDTGAGFFAGSSTGGDRSDVGAEASLDVGIDGTAGARSGVYGQTSTDGVVDRAEVSGGGTISFDDRGVSATADGRAATSRDGEEVLSAGVDTEASVRSTDDGQVEVGSSIGVAYGDFQGIEAAAKTTVGTDGDGFGVGVDAGVGVRGDDGEIADGIHVGGRGSLGVSDAGVRARGEVEASADVGRDEYSFGSHAEASVTGEDGFATVSSEAGFDVELGSFQQAIDVAADTTIGMGDEGLEGELEAKITTRDAEGNEVDEISGRYGGAIGMTESGSPTARLAMEADYSYEGEESLKLVDVGEADAGRPEPDAPDATKDGLTGEPTTAPDPLAPSLDEPIEVDLKADDSYLSADVEESSVLDSDFDDMLLDGE